MRISTAVVLRAPRFKSPTSPVRSRSGGLFAFFLSGYKQENAMQEEKNKQVIREFTKTFKNQHNVDGVGHLFDKNFVHHFRAPLPTGFEGL
jgi:hypothetical protein